MSKINNLFRAYFIAGFVLMICLSVAVYAAMDCIGRQSLQKTAQHARLYWDSLLTAHYDLYGNWSHLESYAKRYENDPVLSPLPGRLQLLVWDAEQQPIYGTGNIDSARPIPLLHDGKLAGSFYLRTEDDDASYIPIVFAAVIFITGLTFITLLLRTMRSKLLTEIEQRRATASALESARQRITRLEHVRSTMIAEVAHELRNR